jgi:CRP-like cAMP-binding protein
MRSTDADGILDRDATKNAPAPARAADASETIAALRAELAAVRAERDALREELRQRREIADRFLAVLERRQREAREQEDNPEPERGRLH